MLSENNKIPILKSFNKACENGNIKLVKKMLFEKKIFDIDNFLLIYSNGFNLAYINNNIEIYELLKSKLIELKIEEIYPIFNKSIEQNNMDLIKYFLESDKKDWQLLHLIGHQTAQFIYACDKNQIKVIDFLLTSNLLENNINVHVEEDYAFKNAYKKQDKDLLNYLIFDYKIEKTPLIIEIIKRDIEIDRLFYASELNNKLPDKQLKNKKKKI